MEMRQLNVNDVPAFREFNAKIIDALEHKEWFIPFDADDDGVFTPEHDFFYGMFDGDKLIAMSGLIFAESFLGELRARLGLEGKKIAELGESMVLPEYRGRNIMYQINTKLMEKAKEMGLEYIVATIHPENMASRTSAERLGLQVQEVFMRRGEFLRNLYKMKI